MTLDEATIHVQLAYPQIYLACHTRHRRARTSAHGLSARDISILVHLDRTRPTSLSALAGHLNLSPSTVSEAITTMARHGFAAKSQGGSDRRSVQLILTPLGLKAVRAESVLEDARLRGALKTLSRAERAQAITGLNLLAEGCRRAQAPGRRPRTQADAASC